MTTELMKMCEALILKNGNDFQTQKFIEECAEAIVAISHFRDGKCSRTEVISELCDTYITLSQMLLIFDINCEFGEILNSKIIKAKLTL